MDDSDKIKAAMQLIQRLLLQLRGGQRENFVPKRGMILDDNDRGGRTAIPNVYRGQLVGEGALQGVPEPAREWEI